MEQPNPSARSPSNEDLQDNIALGLWDGNESVVEAILTHYGPVVEKALMKKYAPHLGAEDCEDVVCEAISRLWQARSTYDDKKAKVKTWLYKIADNCAKDVLRSGWHKAQEREQGKEPDLLEELATYDRHAGQHEPDEDDPLNGGMQAKESKLMQDFRQVLSSLPETQRLILEQDALAGEDGVDTAVLGARLGGIPAATIRVYRKRAKDAVQAEMKKRGHNLDRKGMNHE